MLRQSTLYAKFVRDRRTDEQPPQSVAQKKQATAAKSSTKASNSRKECKKSEQLHQSVRACLLAAPALARTLARLPSLHRQAT